MLDPTKIFRFVVRNLKLIFLLIAVNLFLSVIAIYSFHQQQFRAEVQITFNEVKLSFDQNHATDYLFEDDKEYKKSTEFVNILQTDSLLRKTVIKHSLSDHYKIPKTNPNRIKKAIEILRRKIKFTVNVQSSDHALIISLMGKDPNLIELVLSDLADQVNAFRSQQIDQNNAVTRHMAKLHMQDLKEHPTSGMGAYRPEVLASIIRQIDLLEDAPRYKPYFIARNGAVDATLSLAVVIALALLANLIAFFIEVQLMYLISVLRKYAQQGNMN